MICTKQVCPNCMGSDSERGEMEEVGDGMIWFPSVCNNCGAKFNEVFKFLQTEILPEKNLGAFKKMKKIIR